MLTGTAQKPHISETEIIMAHGKRFRIEVNADDYLGHKIGDQFVTTTVIITARKRSLWRLCFYTCL